MRSSKQHPNRHISIHALREEGDPPGLLVGAHPARFLSTPSARRATLLAPEDMTPRDIFLSTPSARRATGKCIHLYLLRQISIHALREEGDVRQRPLATI